MCVAAMSPTNCRVRSFPVCTRLGPCHQRVTAGETCIRVCVDLAGVDRSVIELTVEPRRLVIRGTPSLPERNTPKDPVQCWR